MLVHDFSGHPFQVQLSRELARRGLQVLHVYCSSYTTGRGDLSLHLEDPDGLAIRDVPLDGRFAKYSFATRVRQEHEYARRFAEVVDEFGPDLVIESNDPLLAKRKVAAHLDRAGIPWVFWLQDLYSVAIAGQLERRLGRPGRLAGRVPLAIEADLLRRAAAVVAITPDFDARLDGWRVVAERRAVIPNWAPLDEVVALPASKAWTLQHGIDAARVVLYAGTLGLKHDPSLLLEVARGVDEGTAVVVVSEGAGADWLRERVGEQTNLHVLGFTPYEQVSAMLAAADVTVTIVNGDAGSFSVPSKLLTYLCGGRPVVAAVPEVNLAARVLREAGAGTVVAPDDAGALRAAVVALLADEPGRAAMGAAGRRYAEQEFDVSVIADRFLAVLGRAVDVRPTPQRRSAAPLATTPGA